MQYKEFILGILCAIILLLGSQYFYNKNEFYHSQKPMKFINHLDKHPYKYKVKIIGAVKYPGVVIVTNTPPRLIDAINLAGGLHDQANLDVINFAQDLYNAKLIIIPFQGQNEVIILKNPKHKHKRHKHKKHKRKKHKHKKKHKRTFANERFMAKLFMSSLENNDYLAPYDNAINSIVVSYKKDLKKLKKKDSETEKPAKKIKRNPENIEKPSNKENNIHKITPKKPKEKKASKEFPLNSLDINKATKEELMKLPGIGEKTATLIIEFRQENPIKSKEDLLKIKGIGPKKLEKILPFINFEENKPVNE